MPSKTLKHNETMKHVHVRILNSTLTLMHTLELALRLVVMPTFMPMLIPVFVLTLKLGIRPTVILIPRLVIVRITRKRITHAYK